jgi:predicted O-methyltransferase YrrM
MLTLEEIETVFQQYYFDGMGAVSRGDAKFLCDLIEESRPSKCFEVGVASGMSTTFLLKALAKVGPESQLVSVDISRQYYADRTKQVGYVVDEAIAELGCKFELHFNHWSADAEKFAADEKFDFVFIDAHHSHPWATLDTMLVLPFVKPGAWIACHDITLHKIPRFVRETGPFHVYKSFPAPKRKSSFENQNIGAFQVTGNHRDYEEYLLASLAQKWTVSGMIKQSFYDRIFEIVERFYSVSFAARVRTQVEAHNRGIALARSRK